MKNHIFISTLFFVLFSFFLSTNSYAHDAAPCLLSIEREPESEIFRLLWKIPEGNYSSLIIPEFEPNCAMRSAAQITRREQSELWRATYRCSSEPRSIIIPQLAACSETIVRYRNGEQIMAAATTHDFEFPEKSEIETSTDPVTFIGVGIHHILLGWDHLTFVLCLLLLSFPAQKTAAKTDLLRAKQKILLLAVTAFTIGHSISLLAVVLGSVGFASSPIEALIAFSILLLAGEAVSAKDFTKSIWKLPLWAGSFGLIHGLGFAGAIQEIGLPQKSRILTLLAFNIGVEIGQLLFIFATFLLYFVVSKIFSYSKIKQIHRSLAYTAGIIAAYWLAERVIGFWQ